MISIVASLKNIRQGEAVRAFVRLGGEERRGKGSHQIVNLNQVNLSVPHGILKEGLIRHLIKIAGLTEDEFLEAV